MTLGKIQATVSRPSDRGLFPWRQPTVISNCELTVATSLSSSLVTRHCPIGLREVSLQHRQVARRVDDRTRYFLFRAFAQRLVLDVERDGTLKVRLGEDT